MEKEKKIDLLEAVAQIVERAYVRRLNSEFYSAADIYIKYIAEKMELTKDQSIMMAFFIDNYENKNITFNDLAKNLCHRPSLIMKYVDDIDVLETRELVRCSRRGNGRSYRVPEEVFEAFKRDEKFVPKDYSGVSCQELFCEIAKLFDLRMREEVTYYALTDNMCHLFDCNKQLLYVQQVKGYNLTTEEEMMLILFSHLFVNENDYSIEYDDIDFLYEDDYTWKRVKSKMNCGTHSLLKRKIIEYGNNDGLVDRESFRITTKAKRELFAELNISYSDPKNKCGGVIKSEEIVTKKLFYGDKVSSQVAELGKLLNNEQYVQIRNRMRESGFRCGFTCLFYGEPGTGKTETVLQLAKKTGRDILQVNISQIKSMWVGESEKNIKYIFDNYRAKVKDYTIAPILLFNEADAIIGKRKEGVERAVDKMENTIQNIILQEMETLDGILIATTNLAQNMDKAFERRFLYKIRFEKPTIEARMKMWHEMIPALNEEERRILATKYNFSGGQIENIARHYTIYNILHGESENIIEALSSHCDNENLSSQERRKIGFDV